MSRLVARLVLVGSGLLVLLAAPGGATASCVMLPGGIEEQWQTSDVVFVGTVTATENMDRRALVDVEEIWKGGDLPAEVVVHGGPDDPGTMSSVDRTYIAGTRYVFAVMLVDGELQDNGCSGTVDASSIDLDAMRPTDTREPTTGDSGAGGIDLAGLAGPGLILGVIGGLVVLVVAATRRREA